MSLLESLRKIKKEIARPLAAGLMAVSGVLTAQTGKAEELKPNTPIVQKTQQQSTWIWGDAQSNLDVRRIYESLPDEYKAFAGKSFEERLEMCEYMNQKDFLRRDRMRSELLKKNPMATLGDMERGGVYPKQTYGDEFATPKPNPTLDNKRLADSPTGRIDYYGRKLLSAQIAGTLTDEQVDMAHDLITLGRPMGTIDKSLPLSEQLAMCGFDVASQVAAGEKTHLTALENSILIAQGQESARLRLCLENEKANVDFNKRLSARTVERSESTDGELIKINGELVKTSADSVRGNIARKVADKIVKEERATTLKQAAERRMYQ